MLFLFLDAFFFSDLAHLKEKICRNPLLYHVFVEATLVCSNIDYLNLLDVISMISRQSVENVAIEDLPVYINLVKLMIRELRICDTEGKISPLIVASLCWWAKRNPEVATTCLANLEPFLLASLRSMREQEIKITEDYLRALLIFYDGSARQPRGHFSTSGLLEKIHRILFLSEKVASLIVRFSFLNKQ